MPLKQINPILLETFSVVSLDGPITTMYRKGSFNSDF